MLWKKENIKVFRNEGEIDENDNYAETVVYESIESYIVEVKEPSFNSDISREESQQIFCVMISLENTDIRLWDHISYTDNFWDVELQIITRPKTIIFEESESFIKCNAKLIWG